MNNRILHLAARVVQRASRDNPADAVLRAELRGRPGLSRAASREVSRAVFAYYRWRGWLDAIKPLSRQLEQALELNARFAQNPQSFTDDELGRGAVPGWIGDQMETPAAWRRSLQGEPKLWLRARPGTGPKLAEELGKCQACGAGELADALSYTGDEDLFRTSQFHAGQFELQDLASQWVGGLCRPQPGEVWWDACAGEGGKTLHLSDLMRNQGLIWASDRADWRLRQLRRRAARARVFNYRLAPWDGGAKLPTRTRFDGVLVDAPCSGVGTWQRNPQARWTTTVDDVGRLASLQLQLLWHAAPAVKAGGRLIYAVCTLTRVETTEVVRAFQERRSDFEPWANADPLAPAVAEVSQHWLWPQSHGSNGMFVAFWRRRCG